MAATAVKQTNQKALKENERKWGLPLLKAGWSLIPSAILVGQRDLGLTPIDVNIVLHLVNYWWYADRMPYPSKARISEAIGVHNSTVQRRIRRMERDGLIQRIPRSDRRGQSSNMYDLQGLVDKATVIAKRIVEEKENKIAEKETRTAIRRHDLKVVGSSLKPR